MQIVRFLAVGVFNTCLGMAFILAAMKLFGADYRWANAIGYAAGCTAGFVLNRAWTFRHAGDWRGSLARWLAVIALAYGLNLLAVIALHEDFGIDAYAAQLCGAAVYTSTSFLGGRLFAFAAPQRETRASATAARTVGGPEGP